MWRNRFAVVGTVILLIGGASLITAILLTDLFDQTKLPLFIAAWSSLFSATGAVASWLVILEMQKDREALFKPEVTVDIDSEAGLFLFVVRNDGRSPAHNVVIRINPSPINHKGVLLVEDTPWLQHPIRTLLPGRNLVKVIDSHVSMFEKDVPRRFEIQVEYESSAGVKHIEEPYVLDVEQWRGTKLPTPPIEITVSKLAETIEKIEKKLK